MALFQAFSRLVNYHNLPRKGHEYQGLGLTFWRQGLPLPQWCGVSWCFFRGASETAWAVRGVVWRNLDETCVWIQIYQIWGWGILKFAQANIVFWEFQPVNLRMQTISLKKNGGFFLGKLLVLLVILWPWRYDLLKFAARSHFNIDSYQKWSL